MGFFRATSDQHFLFLFYMFIFYMLRAKQQIIKFLIFVKQFKQSEPSVPPPPGTLAQCLQRLERNTG